MALQHVRGFVRTLWDFVRIARISGGGESGGIWKFGPLCVKRWSSRIPPAEVHERSRVSRIVPACNAMYYIPWLHWTIARWVVGYPATHDACNLVLAAHPVLCDLHPGNVLAVRDGTIVIDFSLSFHPAVFNAGRTSKVVTDDFVKLSDR